MVAEVATPFIEIGPPNAWTDPETGLRFYDWQGRQLPSATTIRRLAGIPHRLSQWQISKVVDRAVTEHMELQRMLTRERRPRERVLEKNRITEASKWLRAAATEERDASAKLGTLVHDACAQGFDPDTLEPALQPRVRRFREWLERYGAVVLATEFQCWNLTHGYAGTADLLVRFPNGQIWLVDLKTGKGTYAEHALQLTYYRMAEFVGRDGVVDQATTELLQQAAGIAVLHLTDDHWEFRSIRLDDETWRAARGLLAFAMWSHVHADIGDVTLASRRSA
jgi:hypothetical protein